MVSVSVIVPVYNKVQYLQKTIDSILGQTLNNIEILLIDDQSTDGSYELCQRLYCGLPQVKLWQNVRNMGAGLTRNAGIERAKGRFLAFVDADDILHADYLKHLYQAAIINKADIAAEAGDKIAEPVLMESLLQKRVEHVYNFDFMTSAVQKLFSRDLIMKSGIRFHQHVFLEDVLFSLENLFVASRVVMVPGVLYELVHTPKSITRGNLLEKVPAYMDSVIRAVRQMDTYMAMIPELADDRNSRQMILAFLVKLSFWGHFAPVAAQYPLEEINQRIKPVLQQEFGDNYAYVLLLVDWCINFMNAKKGE
ncbi:glycosyltransferase family 2 protein [Selenomonas ruminantium]|uniref:glycosyltransferase family 2 protein n=1 Tax=Selenomonas ruminantium TaxID=971 RepID=UPI00047A82FE|nr:glycosyltransferase family 2 protein [Selenomonas ruminantium]